VDIMRFSLQIKDIDVANLHLYPFILVLILSGFCFLRSKNARFERKMIISNDKNKKRTKNCFFAQNWWFFLFSFDNRDLRSKSSTLRTKKIRIGQNGAYFKTFDYSACILHLTLKY